MTAKSKAAKKLNLGKVLDLNEATALHTKLLSMRGHDIIIDAAHVEKAGALCVQVLMSAAKSWEEDRHAFHVSNMSNALAKTLQLIGVKYDHLLA
jgi:chemotaxis protein CheX